jgi:TatD DNase family protein
MHLFDAHSHLPEAEMPGPNHPRVICGTCEADWEAVLTHAKSDGQVIPMLGLHPWFVAEALPGWERRLEALLHRQRAGVGECGLDFARKETDQAQQEAAFRIQLQLAHRLRRPVAMHVVRAWGRILDLLREEGTPSAGAMIHAYSGSPEMAERLQSMGVFLSFSGDLLNPERAKIREALLSADSRNLLLESDGSADLRFVIGAAAHVRGVPQEDLATQTWENGQRCFKELLA